MSQALTPYQPHTALDVDDAAAAHEASKLMKHAQSGGGLFPKDMSEAQAVQIARLSLAYGLDLFAEEMILYQSKPYLTIKGALRIANEHPKFEGIECVPATDAERKAFRCREEEHLWKATVWRRDRRIPVVNYGRASAGDGNPVSSKWAQEMAQKRAKHRALRDAFSLPVPGREEVVTEAYERPREYEHDVPLVIDGDVVEVNTIRDDQVRAIHTIYKLLGWSEDEYREVLSHTYHVASSLDLLEGQASSFLEMLESLAQDGSARRFLEGFMAKTGLTAHDLANLDGESDPKRQRPASAPTEQIIDAEVVEVEASGETSPLPTTSPPASEKTPFRVGLDSAWGALWNKANKAGIKDHTVIAGLSDEALKAKYDELGERLQAHERRGQAGQGESATQIDTEEHASGLTTGTIPF